MSININPWGDSLEKTFGYMLDCMEKTTHTGTFVGGSTVSFDTGLGEEIKYLVILDESATGFPLISTASEGIYIYWYDFEDAIGQHLESGTVNVPNEGFTSPTKCFLNRANSVSMESGVFEYVPKYDGNELYNNFTPNHTYRWFAW